MFSFHTVSFYYSIQTKVEIKVLSPQGGKVLVSTLEFGIDIPSNNQIFFENTKKKAPPRTPSSGFFELTTKQI